MILDSIINIGKLLESPIPSGCTDPVTCDTPYREVFFNIDAPYDLLFYFFALFASIIMLLGFLRLFRIWMVGKNRFNLKLFIRNISYVLKDGLFNKRIFRYDRYAGIMHFFVMWGTIALFIATVILTVHERQLFIAGGFLFGDLYLLYSFLADFFGIILIIGILMAFYRRYIERNARVKTETSDGLILLALFVIAISGIIIEALRIEASGMVNSASFEIWSFAGYTVALILSFFSFDISLLEGIHFITWWGHAIAVEVLIIYFPFSKMAHVAVAPFNMLYKENKPFGKVTASLEPIKTVKDMSASQLISLDSCMRCARCTFVCPAQASGSPLDPRMVILDSQSIAHNNYPFLSTQKPFFSSQKGELTIIPGGNKVTDEILWDCTNCMACVNACPVWINHVDIITGMRAALVDEGKQVPAPVITFLESVLQNNNEWGESKKNRMKWAEGLEVPEIKKNKAELLWYVGCTSCYDPRNQKVAQMFAKILNKAGVEFGTLGAKERCTGDAVRRVGEEALFQDLVEKNIQAFDKSGSKRIVTTSPHSFNTIKNEYPEFGGNFEVLHHTQLLWELIQEGKIQFTKEVNRTVTFHDPCYLGRYNDIIDPPREILKTIPGLTIKEMKRSGRESFCCGGGGGKMFMPSHTEIKPSEIRIKEAVETEASVLAVGCPWCMSMFEDASKTIGVDQQLSIFEICELIAEAMDIM
ncbi:MAG: heterodisulfide reductase-related iron-sulfur binding cluster [Candidatus Hodarchaeales archaeon]|jgi:Fe-S oxidoreductase/nitrate reductase gamma subunit